MLRFHFAAKMGNQKYYPIVTPRIQAVQLRQYPRRAFSLSRWYEIRDMLGTST